MRDPDRIDPMIDKLRDFWKDHPDWRLGQLISNAYRFSPGFTTDIFYIEDDSLMQGLDNL